MLETTSERLSARGGPHFGSPDKLPAARLETLRLAGEARVPFTTGILIGIGETREERLDALRAIAARRAARAGGDRPELPRQARHADGRRARAAARGAALDDRGGAAHPAAGGRGAGAAEPERRLRARCSTPGIDDWGGVSPVTIDHVNPEAPWPEVEALRAACASRGLELAPRLTVYPRSPRRATGSTPACCRARCARPTRSGSRARTRGRPASRARAVRRLARSAAGRRARRAGRGRDRAPLPRARRGAAARLRGGRRAAARGERRRRHLRRDAERPVHERLLLPLRLLRVLEGQAGGQPARRAVPRAARGDRAPRGRGVGARRDRDLPAGRDPPGVRRRLLRLGRARDQGRGARSARARVQRARGLAGRGDARRPAARRT